jgi:predicted phosphodiesterase
MEKTHILQISDIHLGNANCHAGLLLKTLKGFDYEILILGGDTHENGSDIRDEKQLELIEYLREQRKKIKPLYGNHDPPQRKPDRILGLKLAKKYTWKVGQKKYCAIHGHQFDRFLFIFSEPFLDKLISFVIYILRWLDPGKIHMSKWLDDFHKNHSLHVAKRAYKYAKRHKIDNIFYGHVHLPGNFTFFDKKSGKIINCYDRGSWIENPSSFVTVDKDGTVKLRFVEVPEPESPAKSQNLG